MKQKSSHLLALLSLLAMSSIFFGSELRAEGKEVDILLADGATVRASELERYRNYWINGVMYFYDRKSSLNSDDTDGDECYIFVNDHNERLELRQQQDDAYSFLITSNIADKREVRYIEFEDEQPVSFSEKIVEAWGKCREYQKNHPLQMKAGCVAAVVGGLLLLKKTYDWCCGSKESAPKKALSKRNNFRG